jgi:meso-butanediol dehydrogenase/(S,S)-butanediol dehydrogenase/diacetyl reductase
VQNAGISRGGPVAEATDEDIDALVDINLKGPIHVMRAAVPHLRRSQVAGGASVIQISSTVTFLPPRNVSIYSATKAGLEMLTRCWAADLAPDVRVNAISAGVVETPMLEGMVPSAKLAGLRASFIAQTPLGRLGGPSDVAALALYLASDASAWMTGAILPLDGGISLGPPPA